MKLTGTSLQKVNGAVCNEGCLIGNFAGQVHTKGV